VEGFRSAIGLYEAPKSPETVRGGDTSLFSLPSDSANDATPHTSNVSVATTISSAISPERRARPVGYYRDRVNLRDALHTFCSLLDELNVAMEALLHSQGGPRRQDLDNLRSAYLHCLDIPDEDLKSLVDSFELNLAPLSIHRVVSEDNHDTPITAKPQTAPIEVPTTTTSSEYQTESPNATLVFSGITTLEKEQLVSVNVIEDDDSEDHPLFSPNTADMASIEQSIDDLRRTVGSFDFGEVEESREESPQPLDVNRLTEKINKPRRSFWKRRPLRRQAVE